jgi:hypothetical protein
MTIHKLLECYNVTKEEHEEEDPGNVQIPETEGARAVEWLELAYAAYTQPIKIKKVNIGILENPKFVQICDYWNDETVEKVAELLREYHDLFPTTFSKMKGIAGDLGEMNIPLKLGAKPIRQRPYRLNPSYKGKVKTKIDKMLDVGIIEPVEES